jgi:hypothetical protein
VNYEYDMEVLVKERKITFERSVSANPSFWYGLFTGMVVS